MVALPNPERSWERSLELTSIDRFEVTSRIGMTHAAVGLLSGGLANQNLRVGTDRVLRIYRRDRRAAAKEAALLARPWQSFRVPALHAIGSDFLLLEYVEHGALRDGAEQGAAVGCALAEIHAVPFKHAGFLTHELEVAQPFVDFPTALCDHVQSQSGPLRAAGCDDLVARILGSLRERRGAMQRFCQRIVLLHGDFKASNLHWTPSGQLLVLDWEFAFAGPALMDIGQLFRWAPSGAFATAFADAYVDAGGQLPEGWSYWANVFDLGNLVGLLASAGPASRRLADVRRRAIQTLDML